MKFINTATSSACSAVRSNVLFGWDVEFISRAIGVSDSLVTSRGVVGCGGTVAQATSAVLRARPTIKLYRRVCIGSLLSQRRYTTCAARVPEITLGESETSSLKDFTSFYYPWIKRFGTLSGQPPSYTKLSLISKGNFLNLETSNVGRYDHCGRKPMTGFTFNRSHLGLFMIIFVLAACAPSIPGSPVAATTLLPNTIQPPPACAGYLLIRAALRDKRG